MPQLIEFVDSENVVTEIAYSHAGCGTRPVVISVDWMVEHQMEIKLPSHCGFTLPPWGCGTLGRRRN
ncbi:hypothetical protein V6N13_042830 [Hibiscus sabdariffa]